jgi:hypothetical protein
MVSVTLKISWHDLFSKDMPEEIRKERWQTWKKLAIKNGDKDLVGYWTDISACYKCDQRKKDWCNLQGLPVTINPYLTMDYGILGMACMGLYRSNDYQPDLFDFWEEKEKCTNIL